MNGIDCQAELEVSVGLAGVDGLPGDEHTELVACGQPATTTLRWRDDEDDKHCCYTETLCEEHAASVRWAAEQGFLTILDDAISA